MAEKDTEYLNTNEPFRRVNLIGGAYATVDTASLVGYCHNDEHKGFVTVTIMNEHDCIGKGCNHFERFEDYPFWVRYHRKEDLKKLRKEKAARRKENKQRELANIDRQNDMYISKAYYFAEKFGLNNFKIISIHKEENGFVIFYMSDKPFNDWYDFREIAFAMNRTFNKKFTLKHTKLADGSFATI